MTCRDPVRFYWDCAEFLQRGLFFRIHSPVMAGSMRSFI